MGIREEFSPGVLDSPRIDSARTSSIPAPEAIAQTMKTYGTPWALLDSDSDEEHSPATQVNVQLPAPATNACLTDTASRYKAQIQRPGGMMMEWVDWGT